MPSDQLIDVRPIGVVETSVADDDVARQRRSMVYEICIFADFRVRLMGIEGYSHIIVLFWMHCVERSSNQVVYPRGDTSLPLTGVLASRGRGHPNPIGLAVAELIKRDEHRLTVRRLDAYHGTPIIDIKPYDRYDVVTDIKMPQWFDERSARSRSSDPKASG